MRDKIFLAQSDTTAGFLCANSNVINKVKKSSHTKLLLKECSSSKNLRAPNIFKNIIRKSRKTSFIIKGKSFRVIGRDSLHYRFLYLFKELYSSSANTSGKDFNYDFALKNSNIVVKDKRGIYKDKPSNIFKINYVRMIKIR